MIVGKTIIEKTIFGVGRKMLEKCTIKTQFLSSHQAITRIPISKRSPCNQGTKNHLAVARKSRDKQSPSRCQVINEQKIT